jgi:hypothetical protein
MKSIINEIIFMMFRAEKYDYLITEYKLILM